MTEFRLSSSFANSSWEDGDALAAMKTMIQMSSRDLTYPGDNLTPRTNKLDRLLPASFYPSPMLLDQEIRVYPYAVSLIPQTNKLECLLPDNFYRSPMFANQARR
jgi:hypothetical protein